MMAKSYGKKDNPAVKGGAKQFGVTSSVAGDKKGFGITSSGYSGDRKQIGLKQDSYGKSSNYGITSAYAKGVSPYSEKSFSDPRGR
jgi:hypothetical protein